MLEKIRFRYNDNSETAPKTVVSHERTHVNNNMNSAEPENSSIVLNQEPNESSKKPDVLSLVLSKIDGTTIKLSECIGDADEDSKRITDGTGTIIPSCLAKNRTKTVKRVRFANNLDTKQDSIQRSFANDSAQDMSVVIDNDFMFEVTSKKLCLSQDMYDDPIKEVLERPLVVGTSNNEQVGISSNPTKSDACCGTEDLHDTNIDTELPKVSGATNLTARLTKELDELFDCDNCVVSTNDQQVYNTPNITSKHQTDLAGIIKQNTTINKRYNELVDTSFINNILSHDSTNNIRVSDFSGSDTVVSNRFRAMAEQLLDSDGDSHSDSEQSSLAIEMDNTNSTVLTDEQSLPAITTIDVHYDDDTVTSINAPSSHEIVSHFFKDDSMFNNLISNYQLTSKLIHLGGIKDTLYMGYYNDKLLTAAITDNVEETTISSADYYHALNNNINDQNVTYSQLNKTCQTEKLEFQLSENSNLSNTKLANNRDDTGCEPNNFVSLTCAMLPNTSMTQSISDLSESQDDYSAGRLLSKLSEQVIKQNDIELDHREISKSIDQTNNSLTNNLSTNSANKLCNFKQTDTVYNNNSEDDLVQIFSPLQNPAQLEQHQEPSSQGTDYLVNNEVDIFNRPLTSLLDPDNSADIIRLQKVIGDSSFDKTRDIITQRLNNRDSLYKYPLEGNVQTVPSAYRTNIQPISSNLYLEQTKTSSNLTLSNNMLSADETANNLPSQASTLNYDQNASRASSNMLICLTGRYKQVSNDQTIAGSLSQSSEESLNSLNTTGFIKPSMTLVEKSEKNDDFACESQYSTSNEGLLTKLNSDHNMFDQSTTESFEPQQKQPDNISVCTNINNFLNQECYLLTKDADNTFTSYNTSVEDCLSLTSLKAQIDTCYPDINVQLNDKPNDTELSHSFEYNDDELLFGNSNEFSDCKLPEDKIRLTRPTSAIEFAEVVNKLRDKFTSDTNKINDLAILSQRYMCAEAQPRKISQNLSLGKVLGKPDIPVRGMNAYVARMNKSRELKKKKDDEKNTKTPSLFWTELIGNRWPELDTFL